ncbi:expansin-like B1 isoform X2 [Punica granatum]|uniref:Expansin-like B1 isoform X2 n=1 Tax=Punica granatum TaxID=22663 RepID=A0A6P8DIP1_PUNGR|nr:expansin-like B1 isoform X2 [Punica granatum]
MASSRPTFNNAYYLFCALLLLPAVCYCQDYFAPSRATYYGSPRCYGTPTGACGYGQYGRDMNDGYVTGVSRLYRNGSGCGACYQVRCTKPQCTEDGVNVVATDYGEGDRTDFILSPQAYGKMSQPDKTEELFAYGVVDVEFRRIPCRYWGYNLMLKVHERSKQPSYLAIVILHVAGRNDITDVEFWQEDCQQWRPMRRAYGVVFDLENPPRGDIYIRFQVSGTNGVNWVQPKNGIPSNWKAGATYDTQIQLD